MEDYNKIIESLSVRFIKANNIRILKPVTIANFYDVENTVVILNKGSIRFGSDVESVKEGEVLFVPGGKKSRRTWSSIGGAADTGAAARMRMSAACVNGIVYGSEMSRLTERSSWSRANRRARRTSRRRVSASSMAATACRAFTVRPDLVFAVR